MGATEFGHTKIGRFKDSSEAYNDLVEEAQYDEGHDAYSGTIATTNGYNIYSDNPRFGTKAFNKWEDKSFDKMEKRDCYCIEITGAPFKRIKDNSRFKGKKGIKAFYFFGLAAC